jgi:hypothetical protein
MAGAGVDGRAGLHAARGAEHAVWGNYKPARPCASFPHSY